MSAPENRGKALPGAEIAPVSIENDVDCGRLCVKSHYLKITTPVPDVAGSYSDLP